MKKERPWGAPQKQQKINPEMLTVEGNLGLLAYGYQGIEAWRKKRKEENYNFGQHLYRIGQKPTDDKEKT